MVIRKRLSRIFIIMLTLAFCLPSLAPAREVRGASGTVKSVAVSNLPAKTLTLKKGKSFKLKAKVTVKGKISKAVTYKTSNKKVVAVTKAGKLTAKKKGTAKITIASKANKKKKVIIKVTVGQPVKKITLNQTQATLKVGNAVTLKPTFFPKKPSNKNVIWSSDKPEVASVSKTGVVTANKAGSAVITCLAADGSGKKAVCKIIVNNKKKVREEEEDRSAAFDKASELSWDKSVYSGATTKDGIAYKLTPEESGRYEFTLAMDNADAVMLIDLYDSDKNQLDWVDSSYEERYIAELTKGKTYYIWLYNRKCGFSFKGRKIEKVQLTFVGNGGYFLGDDVDSSGYAVRLNSKIMEFWQGEKVFNIFENPRHEDYSLMLAGFAETPTASGSECINGAKYVAEKSCTLYAIWVEQVSVTFAANNGYFFYDEKENAYRAMVTITYPKGVPLSARFPMVYMYFEDPKRENYEFVGWAVSNTAGPSEIIDLDKTYATEGGKYYAVWK